MNHKGQKEVRRMRHKYEEEYPTSYFLPPASNGSPLYLGDQIHFCCGYNAL